VQGAKVLGKDAAMQNVYKTIIATSTNASGQVYFPEIEWDTYSLTLGGVYDVAEACPTVPHFLNPNTTRVLSLRAVTGGAHNLRVLAKDAAGLPLIDASVELDDLSGSVMQEKTSWCGQVFFGGLDSSTEYELRVGAPGYATSTIASTTVSGVTYQEVILNP
jgi:hypothetical protein